MIGARLSPNENTKRAASPSFASDPRRQALLAACGQDAVTMWPRLPEEFRRDKEFVLAAIRSSPLLPPKSRFEREWPRHLRADRDVVLALARRSDFRDLHRKRRLYVPDSLVGDKDVMIMYCSKIPRSLQECSEALADDEDVVRAAVCLDGLELQYASRRLQEDEDLVRLACSKDGRALEFSPDGPVRQALCRDRDFMLSVLRQSGGTMLRLVEEPLKSDRELLLEALGHGMMWRDCPFELQVDRDFVLEAVGRHAPVYLQFNRTVRRSADVALAAVVSDSSNAEVHRDALELCGNELSSRREVALALAARGCLEEFRKYLKGASSSQFARDKGVMLKALGRDACLVFDCRPPLRCDPDVLLACMEKHTAARILKRVKSHQQLVHPELPIKAIEVAGSGRSLSEVGFYVSNKLWRNHRATAEAWIRRGGRVKDAFQHLCGDRDFALLIAKFSWKEFFKVDDALRSDEAFMEEALDSNGRVFRYASMAIRKDVDAAVRALASHPRALGALSNDARLAAITLHIDKKLSLHQLFVRDFLRGIAILTPHRPPANRSALTMLNRGDALKRLVAEFVGVPFGKELGRMRRARANLALHQVQAAFGAVVADQRERRRIVDLLRNLGDGPRDLVLQAAFGAVVADQRERRRIVDLLRNLGPRRRGNANGDGNGQNGNGNLARG